VILRGTVRNKPIARLLVTLPNRALREQRARLYPASRQLPQRRPTALPPLARGRCTCDLPFGRRRVPREVSVCLIRLHKRAHRCWRDPRAMHHSLEPQPPAPDSPAQHLCRNAKARRRLVEREVKPRPESIRKRTHCQDPSRQPYSRPPHSTCAHPSRPPPFDRSPTCFNSPVTLLILGPNRVRTRPNSGLRRSRSPSSPTQLRCNENC
jgi:hypothetical protein